jgi:NAD+ synthase (glutamine-hydrolysing)
MKNGFVRVAAAIPSVKVADCDYNISQIENLVKQADTENVQVICFPELSVTAYTCADLFFQQHLQTKVHAALSRLCLFSYDISTVIIVGAPLENRNKLYNTAVVIQGGKILGVVPKTFLPNSNEFYEKRWFSPAKKIDEEMIKVAGEEVPFGTKLLFTNENFCFGIELCEDLWVPLPPSTHHAMNGADIIFNLSASNELIGKNTYLRKLIEQQSARCNAGYVYASAGFGESTTDVVFAGNALVAENGKIIAESKRFSFEPQIVLSEIDVELLRSERLRNTNFAVQNEKNDYKTIHFKAVNIPENFKLSRTINKHPFVPSIANRNESCEEIFSIQVSGLAQRWQHTNAKTMVIGISGGLDSTLALLVTVKTADKLGINRERIIGITMPGFGTTGRTYNNAVQLMKSLGITSLEIPIKDACIQHFKDIGHDVNVHDVTYENVQARERTQILMNIANKQNGLVVGTGDLSELAMGWATYNGDHMSMYGVNSGIPKTLVRYLVEWAAHQTDASSEAILLDVLNTPVSPELLPAAKDGTISQKTEDLIGPYELHDFFLYYLIRYGFCPEKILMLAKNAFSGDYSKEIIEKWLKVFMRRFFAQQFKRSCMPDGPKVGSVNLSPRGDWRMPSDAVAFTLNEN